MSTRCPCCGIGYSGRQPGERCGDRSQPRRIRILAEMRGFEFLGPDVCPGRLVWPEDYEFFHKSGDVCRA